MNSEKAKYLRIASDLHIEGVLGQDLRKVCAKYLPHDPKDEESILILAGDVSSRLEQLVSFLEFIEHRFVHVLFVPGNHEFYNHHIEKWFLNAQRAFNERLTNTTAPFDPIMTMTHSGLRFFYGTLWADGGKNPLEELYVQNGLYDFQCIAFEDRLFRVSDMQQFNKRSIAILERWLCLDHEFPVVVVTHHLPSYSLCHPRFGGSINGGFASDCDHMMADGVPALWVHGHTHDTIDTNLYGTRIIANPHGYKTERDLDQFNKYRTKFVTIAELSAKQ